MYGDLNLADKDLVFTCPGGGVRLRSHASAINRLEVRKGTGAAGGILGVGPIYASNSISMVEGKTVDGVDVSELSKIHSKHHVYVGDGNDNRDIDIGVNLAAMTWAVIVIKAAGAQLAVWKQKIVAADFTYFFVAQASIADAIQTLTATGFQVGTHNSVNENTVNYLGIVIWQE